MKIHEAIENLSSTDLIREKDVISTILREAEFVDASIPVEYFEGKHFRDLNSQQLVNLVNRICLKLERLIMLNFTSTPSSFKISIVNPQLLKDYLSQIDKRLQSIEINKESEWARLDLSQKIFVIKLINGFKKQLSFNTARGDSKMFTVFKLLFEKWVSSPNDFISTAELIDKLEELGLKINNRNSIKFIISNLRKKILIEKLTFYIEIENSKGDGYKLTIKNS